MNRRSTLVQKTGYLDRRYEAASAREGTHSVAETGESRHSRRRHCARLQQYPRHFDGARIVARSHQDNPELHKTSLDAIDTALKRGTGLVRQLLTFARKTEVVFGPLLVNDIVKEIIRASQGDIAEDHRNCGGAEPAGCRPSLPTEVKSTRFC